MLCPFCKEEIQDGAIKCKHCGSMLNASAASSHIISYDQVPWYRKNWFAILCFFIFMPALFLVVLTGNIFYKRKEQVRRYSILARIFLILYSGFATLLFCVWMFGPRAEVGQNGAAATPTAPTTSSTSSSEGNSNQSLSTTQPDSDAPPDSFMTSELMVRPGVQETGISIEQFVVVAKHIPLKDGSCSELGSWKKKGKEYFTTLKLGDDTYKLAFWPYSVDFVVLDPVKFGLFDTQEVPAQQFMMLVLAGAQGAARQPNACGGNAPNGKSWLTSARGPRTQSVAPEATSAASASSAEDAPVEISSAANTQPQTSSSVNQMNQQSTASEADEALTPTGTTFTDSDNEDWQFTVNDKGGILKSSTSVIYIGKSCDANSPQLGDGTWEWANDGFRINFITSDVVVGFPRQEIHVGNGAKCQMQ